MDVQSPGIADAARTNVERSLSADLPGSKEQRHEPEQEDMAQMPKDQLETNLTDQQEGHCRERKELREELHKRQREPEQGDEQQHSGQTQSGLSRLQQVPKQQRVQSMWQELIESGDLNLSSEPYYKVDAKNTLRESEIQGGAPGMCCC